MSAETEQAEARRALERRRRALVRTWRTGQLAEQELLDDRRPEWNELSADQRLAQLVDRLGEREISELREIVAALRRLDGGTWGLCQDCGETIAPARLRAMPEARYCIACASEQPVGAPAESLELDEERFVDDVADAIRAYESSPFGTCKRCGEPLELPDAEYCEECTGSIVNRAPA